MNIMIFYINRNTDRGNDNWLIKYEQPAIVNTPSGTKTRVELNEATVSDLNIL